MTPLHHSKTLSLLGVGGDYAVKVFIIVSGFVIAHLILTRRERYGLYILRRALRLYPAYLVGLALGIATLPLTADMLRLGLIGPDTQIHHFVTQLDQLRAHPVLHLLLHLTLLHGMVPYTLLPEAQYMYLTPAWSLSLEWQFYLIAPLFVWGAVRRPVVTALVTVAAYLLYFYGVFGSFYSASFLPGSAWLFLVGTGSRIVLDRLPTFERFPFALAVAMFPVFWRAPDFLPLLLWACVVLYIRTNGGWRWVECDLLHHAGVRSYAVYILHLPVLIGAASLVGGPLGLTGAAAIAVTVVATIALTALLSDLVYRAVERPVIAFGRRIGHEPPPPAAAS